MTLITRHFLLICCSLLQMRSLAWKRDSISNFIEWGGIWISTHAELMLFEMGCLCWLKNSIMKIQRSIRMRWFWYLILNRVSWVFYLEENAAYLHMWLFPANKKKVASCTMSFWLQLQSMVPNSSVISRIASSSLK